MKIKPSDECKSNSVFGESPLYQSLQLLEWIAANNCQIVVAFAILIESLSINYIFQIVIHSLCSHPSHQSMDLKYSKLTRSLSTPRRCSVCIRMVYFKAIRCKDCGNVMHENCVSVTSHWCLNMRRNSYQPIVVKSGNRADSCGNNEPDNWKYMSLPENSETFDGDCLFPNLNKSELQKDESSALESPNIGTQVNGIMKMANWWSHRRKSKEIFSRANAADKHVKSKFSLTADDKSAQKQLKSLIKNAKKKETSSKSQRDTSLSIVAFKESLTDKVNDSQSEICIENIRLCSRSKLRNESTHKAFGNDIHGVVKASDCTVGKFGKHYLVAKAKTLSIETKSAVCERLCATWPQSNQPICNYDDLVEEIISPIQNRNLESKEDIKEWCIPFKDLHFREQLKKGCNSDIYRGEWHGDVLIYTFRKYKTKEEIASFWEEISQFCMIRHENIMLFMGACVELPHLSVITSSRKGPSIFEHIHIRKQSISLPNRINIARQIAQAMGYLHARGIVHKRLHSTNIILESKVKICLMDQAIVEHRFNGINIGVLPKGHLTYFSPELMRSLKMEPPFIYTSEIHTQESDIYAFGTILYELMLSKYPFNRLSDHSTIWLIGNGFHDSIDHIKCSNILKSIIACCWNSVSSKRPEFSFIVKKLQENVSLHKRHSSSEPERLNKTGLSLTANKNICS